MMLADTVDSGNCLKFDGRVYKRLAEEYMGCVDEIKSRCVGSGM